jgi:hypothetical protein
MMGRNSLHNAIPDQDAARGYVGTMNDVVIIPFFCLTSIFNNSIHSRNCNRDVPIAISMKNGKGE